MLLPALSAKEAEAQLESKRLDASHYDRLIEESELGVLPDGHTKYLFLRKTLPASLVSREYIVELRSRGMQDLTIDQLAKAIAARRQLDRVMC